MKTAHFRIEQDEQLLMCVWADVTDESGKAVYGLGRFALLSNANGCAASCSALLSQMGYQVSLETKLSE